jgi:hypothetical protein
VVNKSVLSKLNPLSASLMSLSNPRLQSVIIELYMTTAIPRASVQKTFNFNQFRSSDENSPPKLTLHAHKSNKQLQKNF